jgi:hypothetical protein
VHQLTHRHGDAGALLEQHEHLGGEQRVAAQVAEVVVDSHHAHRQQQLPDVSQRAHQCHILGRVRRVEDGWGTRRRGGILLRAGAGRFEATAVDLAVGQAGELGHEHPARRHPVGIVALEQCGAQLRG